MLINNFTSVDNFPKVPIVDKPEVDDISDWPTYADDQGHFFGKECRLFRKTSLQ
jgi:hypothetical protein